LHEHRPGNKASTERPDSGGGSGKYAIGDASMRSAMNDAHMRKILDLTDVNLVDLSVVQFLICCKDGVWK
jgi:hypothetical protein